MDGVPTDRVAALAELVGAGGVVVVSGAGLSTDSGIPDYRGPDGVLHRRQPMTYQAFVADQTARRRYWARSHLGWPAFASAEPNPGHRALARLERAGLLRGVVTQNVDGLHQRAGSRRVVELHGALRRVVCLDCGAWSSRTALHRRLVAANPRFTAGPGAGVDRVDGSGVTGVDGSGVSGVNPDGDVDLAEDRVGAFAPVPCAGCAGVLKPDVVFFGEVVPADRVATCLALVESAAAVLVVGSSLTVYSGRRFVVHAARRGIPVAVVNRGPTRGDGYATIRLDAPLGAVLPALAERLTGRAADRPSG